ncbi:hypothetical protein L2E82_20037 [Cichorium intybus]|uniref:Uncharacterized protein n=1 Tax=Cichorium intybus TaxID=13427 RepID=A0ACB9DSN2_CICIN|nr:hypothetical protein L2E82_20037 [Cichorium intybus]
MKSILAGFLIRLRSELLKDDIKVKSSRLGYQQDLRRPQSDVDEEGDSHAWFGTYDIRKVMNFSGGSPYTKRRDRRER